MAADAEAGSNPQWVQMKIPYGVSAGDARDGLSYDLYYAKNQSFTMDAVIPHSSGWAELFGEGAR